MAFPQPGSCIGATACTPLDVRKPSMAADHTLPASAADLPKHMPWLGKQWRMTLGRAQHPSGLLPGGMLPPAHATSRGLAECGVGMLRRHDRTPPPTLRKGSWAPYRFVKMRSSSRSPPKCVRSGGASSVGGAAAAALNALPKLRSVHSSVTRGRTSGLLLERMRL